MDRRAFAFLVPYWRRLVLVLAISLVSTATTLVIPYLSKDLIDRALVGRDLDALRRIVSWFIALGVFGFVLNVVSGLRYTRVSAEILFDMRLSLYAHLQRLSPRYYRLGLRKEAPQLEVHIPFPRKNEDAGEFFKVLQELGQACGERPS